MFESFNKRYESTFRNFFNFWVFVWIIINFGDLIIKYIRYDSVYSNRVGLWFFDTMGSLIGLTLGLILIFIMNGIPKCYTKI